MILQTPSAGWSDYEIIDSGNFEKLERFGSFVLARPEPKALWDKRLPEQEWKRLAHTRFVPGAGFARAGKEDSGTWNLNGNMPQSWNISYQGSENAAQLRMKLRLGLTSFKHVGVFPEQAPNWDFIYSQVLRLRGVAADAGEDGLLPVTSPIAKPRVLNLFAYTGAASLAACAAGAEVTHLDSVRQVVSWARGNMESSGLDGIRWVVEDALKFVSREVKRGRRYDGVILDPPAYGHGPDGERWKLDECLNKLMKECSGLLSPENSFLVLNLYSNGYSAMLADTLTASVFGSVGRRISGELLLTDKFGRALPLSVFTRLIR